MVRTREGYKYLVFPNFIIDGSIWPLRQVKNLRGEDIVFAKEAAIERAVFTMSNTYSPYMSKIRNYSYLDHADINLIDSIIRGSFDQGTLDFPLRGVFAENKTLSPIIIDTTAHWPARLEDYVTTFFSGKTQSATGTPLAVNAGDPLLGSNISALYENLRKMENVFVLQSAYTSLSSHLRITCDAENNEPMCYYHENGHPIGELVWEVTDENKIELDYTPGLQPDAVEFWGCFDLQWDTNLEGQGFQDRGIVYKLDEDYFTYDYDYANGHVTLEFDTEDFKALLGRILTMAGANAYRKGVYMQGVIADITMSDHTRWW